MDGKVSVHPVNGIVTEGEFKKTRKKATKKPKQIMSKETFQLAKPLADRVLIEKEEIQTKTAGGYYNSRNR